MADPPMMLSDQPVALEAVSGRTSFVGLPAWLVSPLIEEGNVSSLVLGLDFVGGDVGEERHAYVAWMGDVSPGRAISLPSLLVEALDLHAPLPAAWLLNQLCVVSAGLRVTVCLHNASIVRLRVGEIEPSGHEALRLVPGTEVVVAPRPRPSARAPPPVAGTAVAPERRARARLRVQCAGAQGRLPDWRAAAGLSAGSGPEPGSLSGQAPWPGPDPGGLSGLRDPFEVAAGAQVCAWARKHGAAGVCGDVGAGGGIGRVEGADNSAVDSQLFVESIRWAPARLVECADVSAGHVAIGCGLLATLGVEQGDAGACQLCLHI
ncbi:hypothetical protein T492DRAFT_834117 [Pavlovales sp. CCMP2436]|nr:hypothetical protein T492DRAFT_834117 [Pavlovales sp. CCMP2436]